MGKRRRSVASEVNESEEEDPATPSDTQPHKRVCVDKWSFPDELRSAVRWALIRVSRALNRITPITYTDPHMSEIVRLSPQGKGQQQSSAV